ncbi:GmrSD restriction endonuclease domain-containing protein [Helicobacter pylori]
MVSENFVISIPKEAPLDKAAPLLCAGITVYSPLKFSKVTKGSKVGIAGFGGLGHMALKYAVAMGAQVSVFARNDKKKQMAQKLGATNFYTSVEECKEKFDLIISSIPTQYDLLAYTKLLKYGGEVAIVGIPPMSDNANPAYIKMDDDLHVERILPQNPDPSSQWVKDFSEEERGLYTHSLANLTLLGGKKNTKALSQVLNQDFKEKKEIYMGKTIALDNKKTFKVMTCYKMTIDVAQYTEWTPKSLEKRKEELIKIIESVLTL